MLVESATPGYNDRARADVLHLIPQSCERVLEIGAGTGATIAAIKSLRRVDFSAAVEISPTAVELAREQVSEVVAGDIERLVFPESWTEFDLILCLDVLEHLVDPWKIVAELHKRLRRGGVIVASLPNISYYRATFPLFFRGQWRLLDAGILDRTHLRFFVRDTIAELVTSSGLKLDTIEAGGMTPLSKRWWANKLTLRIVERFLAPQYYVRARRVS